MKKKSMNRNGQNSLVIDAKFWWNLVLNWQPADAYKVQRSVTAKQGACSNLSTESRILQWAFNPWTFEVWLREMTFFSFTKFSISITSLLWTLLFIPKIALKNSKLKLQNTNLSRCHQSFILSSFLHLLWYTFFW